MLEVIHALPECRGQAGRNLALVDHHGNDLQPAADAAHDRIVQLFPHPRFLHADGGKHDDHRLRALETLLENAIDETVARMHFPLVEPRIHPILTQPLRELHHEAQLVFTGVADEDDRRGGMGWRFHRGRSSPARTRRSSPFRIKTERCFLAGADNAGRSRPP